ncbi:glycoside hydrolase family 97 protein [Mucilaginibacter sp. 14171R-50]|uniref:glycoside hydrolase family 97 protein n=1 Tax=Mucilaginibacter sp. 14171R-50 TaxID=2703789 RepID=UPI00138D2A47|nr:glycoside hydrolase family 97 protein [Mucilaginibacter sp. 14171R-50]QHS56909.1 glycoside hydrolase family 97 protein [Mucilaginibacter sp. 14171R-50]
MNTFLRKLTLILTVSLGLLTATLAQTVKEWKVYSPDRSLQINLELNNGSLSYYVQNNGADIIRRSKLGIESSTDKFTGELSFVNELTRKINEIYTLPAGKTGVYRANANQASITFANGQQNQVTIDLRAYNDGVAFRYRFPDSAKTYTLVKELTEFAVPEASAWMQPYGHDPAYENVFKNGIPAGTAAKDSSGWAFPALFHTKDHWLFIAESNTTADNAAMHLQQNCDNGVYKMAFPLAGEGLGQGSPYPVAVTPFATAWRLIIAGKNTAAIVQSNLVNNLAQPNAIGSVSWVKPGRSSWSWWSDHASSRNITTMKRFIDLSAKMNWEYSLVDANWNIPTEGGTIEDLVKYAKQNDVKLTLWYNSGGPHNNVTEQPRDVMFNPDTRKLEMKKLHDWGVKAIKVDFFQSDKQDVMKLYLDILKDAAQQQIMVIFHGSTMPRGWARTYPNLLSMESVRGAENYGWDPRFAMDAAELNTIYVYTRNVAGSMDYTPVTFSDYKCCPHTTTNTHELALSVVFESGMMHFADSDSSYLSQDAAVKKFLSDVPSAWDETRLIQGEPGKDAVIARRKGKNWYIAGINGENVSKNYTISLPFLDHKKSYRGTLFTDGSTTRTSFITMW